MKRIVTILLTLAICLTICACGEFKTPQVAATTLPVYEFTTALCSGTDIRVARLITENVSCLHDYTLQTSQMRAVESAEYIVISGAGLESFLDDVLTDKSKIIDSSTGISLLESCEHHHGDHAHETYDAHIWLSPLNAKLMASNICDGLTQAYPEYADCFYANLVELHAELDELIVFAENALGDLPNRQIITFHDGFSYMADAYDLTILRAIEEESGSEASAAELIDLINVVKENDLRVIFTEANGSTSAADIISAETGVQIYTLDMCLSGESYVNGMYENIKTLKEALE